MRFKGEREREEEEEDATAEKSRGEEKKEKEVKKKEKEKKKKKRKMKKRSNRRRRRWKRRWRWQQQNAEKVDRKVARQRGRCLGEVYAKREGLRNEKIFSSERERLLSLCSLFLSRERNVAANCGPPHHLPF